LVMTHRDPADVLGSCCSLIRNVRALYSDDIDLEGIGQSFAETFELMIARADAYREKHGADAILDVHYADLMRDPIGEVERIYAHFGEPLTDTARRAMEDWMKANPQGKHGRHDYALADYGLSRAAVHERFAAYIERYGIAVRA
ncbi:MAG: sulfotransferase, partial [Novosphingobium sp.]|nr:sulfotransferase [Novosphingobium sp.]